MAEFQWVISRKGQWFQMVQWHRKWAKLRFHDALALTGSETTVTLWTESEPSDPVHRGFGTAATMEFSYWSSATVNLPQASS